MNKAKEKSRTIGEKTTDRGSQSEGPNVEEKLPQGELPVVLCPLDESGEKSEAAVRRSSRSIKKRRLSSPFEEDQVLLQEVDKDSSGENERDDADNEGIHISGQDVKRVRHSQAHSIFRGKGQLWEKIYESPTMDEFDKWLQKGHDSGRWIKKRFFVTKAGSKQIYGCNIKGCKAELCALFTNTGEDVVVSANGKDHQHPDDLDVSCAHGLSAAMKREVATLWNSGMRKPSHIANALLQKGFRNIKDRQVSNYLVKFRAQLRTTPGFQVSELESWCTAHSITQPTAALDADQDKVYVIDHATNAIGGTYHVVLSSKRLLKFAGQATTINVDASNKMRWHSSSVFFLGVSDQSGKFYPVLFCVMREETEANFTQLLQVLKRCVEAASGMDFQPHAVVGHCHSKLTAAIRKVFPGTKMRVCWLDAKREMAKELRRYERDVRLSLEQDIASLQLSCNTEQFETGAELMLLKWRNEHAESHLPDLFEEQFVKRNPGWYEGFDDATFSTNKRLATCVNEVRSRHTLRELLPAQRYMELASDLVAEWSNNVVSVETLNAGIVPNEALLKDTCVLQKLQKTMVASGSAIYVPAGDSTVATIEEVESYERKMKGHVASFDELIEARMSLWKVVDSGEKDDLGKLNCTCPKYLREKLCKHVLAIGSAYGIFSVPQYVWDKLAPTPSGKKRGRPPKKKVEMVVEVSVSGLLEGGGGEEECEYE